MLLAGAWLLAQTKPVFRTGLDIVELDVSVLDKDGHPVLGLTAQDFTVLEEKVSRPIVAFDAVNVEPPVAPPAAWMRDVTPDVDTNSFDNRRLFVIVLDDANIWWDPSPLGGVAALHALRETKVIAKSIIDKLGPQDLASIVFTRDNRYSQDFTGDRTRLLAAVDRFLLGFKADKLYDIYAVKAIRAAAEYLIAVPGRRKALIDISCGPNTSTADLDSAGLEMVKIFEMAQRANVNVHTFYPGCSYGSKRLEFLRVVAEETGGRTNLEHGDSESVVQQVFRETSSYYLLGYQPSDATKIRHVQVLVDRPGVTVNARRMTYPVKVETPERGAPPAKSALAMSGVLPLANLPMRVSAAPFAVPGAKSATVIVVAGVREPGPSSGVNTRGSEEVEVQVRAFTVEGTARGVVAMRAHASSIAGPDGDVVFDVPARIDLAPGRYEIRVGVHSPRVDKDASVYTIVDVPDFSKAPLSLSGIVVHSNAASTADASPAIAALTPLMPTTARDFQLDDDVQTFVRVYQGGGSAPAGVIVRTRILDDHDTVVSAWQRTLPASAFGPGRAADIRDRLRLAPLAPGRYLLTIEASLGSHAARRDVQFSVR